GVSSKGTCKIGWSREPERRLLQVQEVAREPGLRLIHQARSADAFWLEQYVHIAFRHRRVCPPGDEQEWFRLTEAEVQTSKEVGPADEPCALPAAVTFLFEVNSEWCHEKNLTLSSLEWRRLERIAKREATWLVRALPLLIEAADVKGEPLLWVLR